MQPIEPRSRPWAGPIVAIGALILLVTVCLVLGAAPKIHVRKKSSEAKTNLKAIFIGEKALWRERAAFADTIEPIDFSPERGNRYLYLVSNGCDLLVQGAPDGGAHCGVFADEFKYPTINNKVLLAAIPPALRAQVGVHCENDGGCDVLALAVGDLDADPDVDLWSISTKERIIDGETISPGQPYRHLTDLDE